VELPQTKSLKRCRLGMGNVETSAICTAMSATHMHPAAV